MKSYSLTLPTSGKKERGVGNVSSYTPYNPATVLVLFIRSYSGSMNINVAGLREADELAPKGRQTLHTST